MATISDKPWSSFSQSDYSSTQYCAAALIDTNPSGKPKIKDNCKLPVKEPDGTVNRNGLAAAAVVLAGGRGGVSASPQDKRSAARKLIGLYGEAKMPPPDSLKRLAGM